MNHDARLQDPQVLDEIELYGDLVIAASEADEALTPDQIDAVLGLPTPQPPPVIMHTRGSC